MYATDLYFWRRCRVNYPFIFGFKRGTALGWQEVFLLSTGFAVLASASFLANLYLDRDPSTQKYRTEAEKVPLGTTAVRSLEHTELLLTTIINIVSFFPFCQTIEQNASLCNILSLSSFFHCAAYSSHHLLPIQHSIQVKSLFLHSLSPTLYICSSVQGNRISNQSNRLKSDCHC